MQQSSLKGLHGVLDVQRTHRAPFHPRRGYYGRFLTADAPSEDNAHTPTLNVHAPAPDAQAQAPDVATPAAAPMDM